MNNSKHKAKRLSVALLIAVLAVSTSFASVMTGCGNKDESSSTAATVTSTASAANAENTTVANDKSESELNTESNTQSSSSNSTSTANSSQTSEKSESNGSSDSSKAESKSESSKNDASSKNDTSKNDSGNKSSDTLSVDGHDYKKGDTVTVTYTVKSTKVLANFQGTITYDSSKLKVKKAELQSPVKSNSIVNAKNAGVIKFNGSDITSGYDFTNGGDLIVVTYEVTGTGSAKTSYLWESASTIENNKIITHIDNNGKSDGTVSLSTSYK
ncbi:cohesin domain-containing protein [Ruminococcus sp.]|uniref:cohesin domain-containing protein n=1 Tax=Ruminococcus sp. TaxID=41978 RepID=UPI003AF58D15